MIKTSFDKEYPAIRIDKEGNTEIWHNHPQGYTTFHLYTPYAGYIGDSSRRANDEANEEAIKLSGCLGFFKAYASVKKELGKESVKEFSNFTAASLAAAEDEARLNSLVRKIV